MIDKNILKMHFSKNAKNYDHYAKVQKNMAEKLLRMLTSVRLGASKKLEILDIGCGTGHLTRKLLSLYPDAAITAVDIAPGMIEYAKEQFKGSEAVQFLCTDIEEAILDGKYDLILSNAAFQWFNCLEDTVEKLGECLKEKGVLLFSTFGEKTFSELKHSYELAREKLEVPLDLPPSQQFLKLEEVLGICKSRIQDTKGSHVKIKADEYLESEYFHSVKEFLLSVKKIGANNSNQQAKSSPALTKEMMRTYEQTYHVEGFIKATYHCIFVQVEKNPILSTT